MPRRDCHEPWTALPARSPRTFADPDPSLDDETCSRLRDAHDRAEKKVAWTVWASRMVKPSMAVSLTDGTPIPMDDRLPILTVYHVNPLTAEQIARRIADCVNACAGIDDPVGFVAMARELDLEPQE